MCSTALRSLRPIIKGAKSYSLPLRVRITMMMNETQQDRKDEWEKKRVQRVLDYHNRKYGTHIVIKDRTTKIYPHLEGQLNWDWVCYDTKTGEEIAVEVKKLTDEKLEVRHNTIGDVLEEIKNDLSNKLPGSFSLDISISPEDYYLPLWGQHSKQKFKSVLCEVIFKAAQTLKLEEERGLTPQLIGQLPFALPESFFCALCKVSDKGSALYISSGVIGSWSPRLNEHELKNFEELVSHANEQLKQATNAKQTFLVIIEEGLRLTIPDTVAMALEQINPDSYSHINHIYYVSGEKVVEIPPLTP